MWENAREACRVTAQRLADAGIAPEPLAELIPERRVLRFFRKPARMEQRDSVWRLGVFLLSSAETESGHRLYATGRITRAAERARPGYQSRSLEDRRDRAAAAFRGGFVPGEVVHYDADPIPLDDELRTRLDAQSPLGISLADPSAAPGRPPELRVRWRPGASLDDAPTLERYLDERASLLVDPPLGSTE